MDVSNNKKPFSAEELALVEASIDAVMDRIEAEPLAFWSSDGERLATFHRLFGRRIRAWEKSRMCVFRGCSNRSIRRSHTIARNSSLSLLAVNGHVYTPRYDPKEGRVILRRIGVGEASTFPGFCEDHEQLFDAFERIKNVCSMTDHALQAYRVICRELTVTAFQVETMRIMRRELQQRINKWGAREFVSEMARRGSKLDPSKISDFFFEDPQLIQQLNHVIEERTKHHEVNERDFFQPFSDALQQGTPIPMTMITHELDAVVPVALAGRGNFRYPFRSGSEDVDVILNVLPHDGRTVISAMASSRHNDPLKEYFEELNFLPLATLNMIEAWMLRGSDHWFLSPSIWELLDQKRQRAIEAAVADVSRDIAAAPEISIFDELRRRYLDEALAVKHVSPPSWFAAFLEQEEAKLLPAST